MSALIGDTVIYKGKAWTVYGMYSDGKGKRVLLLERPGEQTEAHERDVTRD